jgi:hypothetical protein
MSEDFRPRDKRMSNARLGIDYARGIFFAIIGIVILLSERLKITLGNYHYFFGGLFVAYGLWRFYSTYRRNKRMKEDV